MDGGITVAQFISKWRATALPERAASHEHFIDLCRLLGQQTPAEHDATGAEYTFEKGVNVVDSASRGSKGQYGYADVWWRGKFGWEYTRKDKHKDLNDAYRQLCQYREALENPPLLIVCDITRIEIHTNFTGTRKEMHSILLDEIGHPDNLARLRRVFTDPLSYKPTLSTYRLTEAAAAEFAKIADQLRRRGHDPNSAAHFLMKCMFCLFAEDVKLLPEALFSKLLEHGIKSPDTLPARMDTLFTAMKDGGYFGVDEIGYFNGGLFDDEPALPLTSSDIHAMRIAGEFDWGSVEPSIFGTLFERSLDPSKRSQIGAHYTSREDIMLIVEPVVMAPLRREWAAVQEKVEQQLARRRKATTQATRRKADQKIADLIQDFLHRLASVRVLDPACGSGNFLYVAIQELLGLEKEVIVFAGRKEIGLGLLPRVRPTQLHGIELNAYAAELAQVVIWIGYLQWMQQNGFVPPRDPILSPLTTIDCRDAILAWTDEAGQPLSEWRPGARCAGAAAWPEAEFIIGNPPFLGTKMLRGGLGDEYVDALYDTYADRLPAFSDLCCYWFELAREKIEHRRMIRAGLLATQAIRNEGARTVLDRIKSTGDVFFAHSDRPWTLEGAAVHVAMIGFDGRIESLRTLDGVSVATINSDLSSGADLTQSRPLLNNASLAFIGVQKSGPFDIQTPKALQLLRCPNATDATNADVLHRTANGFDVTHRNRGMWIIAFPDDLTEAQAALYEGPFEYCRTNVQPTRTARHFDSFPHWRLWRSRPAMRNAIADCQRLLITPILTKHRLFIWMPRAALCDHQIVVFARDDDYFFGVLHSSVHELWSLRMGTQLEDRPRYTPTTCFETFPLPWPPGQEPSEHPAWQRISAAAAELNDQRERWLNPPEWIADVARYVDSKHDFSDVPEDARALIRESAIQAEAAREPRLKMRTLTNLYNQRPTWLRLAHEKLDRAVLAAYGAVDPPGGWDEDWAEVWMETGAGQPLPAVHALAPRRQDVEKRVLENLLRLNLARAE